MRFHFTHPYLLNPQHPITVNLIGCGGTGSQVLTLLARMHVALQAMGHPGLYVSVFDGDQVSEANVGRQMYAMSDIGYKKSVVAVTRVNRFFGLNWKAVTSNYTKTLVTQNAPGYRANINITCVDSAKARISIAAIFDKSNKGHEPYHHQFYWLDFGNLKSTGQVVLGTIGTVKQPAQSEHETISKLKNIVELLPGIKKIKEKDQGPSCSLAEALQKQDLFINSTLANLGMDILWKLFTGMIDTQGLYLNLESMKVNPIKV
ncbi:MAG: PRTRC system ThiF family protein [Flavobacteriales bacterium]|nr:PRTRC system ThiF family protein [Flavobacteriales bacterium]